MNLFLYIVLTIFLFTHLILEVYAVYAKYSLASLGKAVLGNAASNIIALASRAALAVYGVVISYLIETSQIEFNKYILLALLSYIFASIATYFLSKFTSSNHKINTSYTKISFALKDIFINYSKNNSMVEKIITYWLYPFVGLQFLVIILAYSAALLKPEHRLTFVASVPFFTMLGSVVTIMYVDSKFALIAESNATKVNCILKEAMLQRCISFSMSAFILLIILCITF